MSQTQLLSQLKFRVASLESALSDKQRELQELHDIQSQADSKIKALNKIHNDKVRSLLGSLQVAKKEKASVEGMNKQHKRSKLIQQLNKQIMDQDVVIQVLRKYIYDEKGRDKGRQICDEIVVKALLKGPQRVRAPTRQELRIEIDKLKAIHLNLEGKAKAPSNLPRTANPKYDENASQLSEASELSFVNQNQEIYAKMRDFQNYNQSLKLELSTKGKIIQKLKGEIKQKDRLRAQVELLTNQLQVSSRKAKAFDQLLRETKENMNAKIAQLFQRELKVQQLELNSRENGQRLKQAHESSNLLLEEIRQEKQQLKVEIELLKKENETLMLENITMKKRQDEQKNKIVEIREMNSKNKEELGGKLKQYEFQIQKVIAQNENLAVLARQTEAKLFQQRASWVEQRTKLIDELQKGEQLRSQQELAKAGSEELWRVRKENEELKEIMQSGRGGGREGKMLLERLENYRIRLQFYQSKQKGKERQLYDQLFDKHNKLLAEFEDYQRQAPAARPNPRRLNIVHLTTQQHQHIASINSSVSQLGLSEVPSSILDNFDSSYDYEVRLQDLDPRKFKGLPKVSEQDKQLLKLLNSDLWDFVRDDRVDHKIEEAISLVERQQDQEQQQLSRRIREIKNLSHPQGKKLVVYDSQIKQMEALSDSVSVTSALQKDIEKYDSDVDIEVRRTIKGSPAVNMRTLGAVSDSFNSSLNVSSAKSGDSSFAKRKKGEKASVLKLEKEGSLSSSVMGSSGGKEMDSSVSSVGVKQSMLAEIDSDISVDFRKKKGKR